MSPLLVFVRLQSDIQGHMKQGEVISGPSWRKEESWFKIILDYIRRLRLAWATRDLSPNSVRSKFNKGRVGRLRQ